MNPTDLEYKLNFVPQRKQAQYKKGMELANQYQESQQKKETRGNNQEKKSSDEDQDQEKENKGGRQKTDSFSKKVAENINYADDIKNSTSQTHTYQIK